jgi:hypothetical protein
VSGESSINMPLGTRIPGRRWRVGTRESGDLPSAVVTREHVGRGALTGAEPVRFVGWGDLVRGDVPPTSRPRSPHVCEATGPPVVEAPPRNPRSYTALHLACIPLRFHRIRTDFGFAADRATSSYGYYATIGARGSSCRRLGGACWSKSGSKSNVRGHPRGTGRKFGHSRHGTGHRD